MTFATKSGLAAVAVLAFSAASFAAQPAGPTRDPNTTVQHSSPTLTPAPSNCAMDDTTAGGMTAHSNSAAAAPAPGSNLTASDAGTAGNAAVGGMGHHNSAGGGAIGNGLSAGSMATPAGTPHTDVSYNLNKCTGSTSGGPATAH